MLVVSAESRAGPYMNRQGHQRHVTLRAAVKTDVGVIRDHNQDAAHIDEKQRFFIVADGMGGHLAGEVASEMAVRTVREALDGAREQIEAFAADPTDEGRRQVELVLEAAVRAAHRAVYERGMAESDKHGMGTTLDVVVVAGTEAFIAHVGDSRTYLVRDGRIAQITTDHTVAEVLLIEGKLSVEEAQTSPLRTILVNAIGVAPDVGVEMAHVQLRKNDLFLLCSDGLHDYFPLDQELADQVGLANPDDALGQIIDLAKSRGGHDNITGLIVQVVDCGPPGDDDSDDQLAWSDPACTTAEYDQTQPHKTADKVGPPQEAGREGGNDSGAPASEPGDDFQAQRETEPEIEIRPPRPAAAPREDAGEGEAAENCDAAVDKTQSG